MSDRRILETYPLPIARAYLRFLNASENRERHDFGYYVFEIYLKVLAGIAIAHYEVGSGRDHRVNAALKGLLRPSVGEWLHFARTCLGFLVADTDAPAALRAMDELLRERSASWPAVVRLRNAVQSIRSGRPEAREKASLGEVLDAMVFYRNRFLGHGAPRDPEHYARFAEEFGAAIPELLDRSTFLRTERLVLFDSIRVVEGSRVECHGLEYMGNQPVRVGEPLRLPYGGEVPECGALYLRGSADDLLRLDPLLIAHREDVYVLNEAGGRPEYLSYSSGDRFVPPTCTETQSRLLERILGYAVDEGEVARLERDVDPGASPERTPDPDGGRILGDFRLLREVGRGSMGAVHEAIQLSLGRRVALKVLPAGHALDPKRVARFRREARATASVHHPSVVPVYEAGEVDGAFYYAMEFIEGTSLADHLAERRSGAAETPAGIPVRDAMLRCAELAEGLAAIHSRGLVHRDVKPSNIVVATSGRWVLVDFGLVRDTSDASLTSSGELVGTLRSMSPEQCARTAIDHRSDLYSLGATLYEVFTGENPHRGESEPDIKRSILVREARDPRRLVPTLSRDLAAILLRCLEKDPDRRYANAEELAEDLRALAAFRPLVHAKAPNALDRARKWVRRHRAVSAAGAALIVLTIVAAAYRSTRPGYLTVTSSEPGAVVHVDGELVGRTPLVRWPVEPGSHRLRLEKGDELRAEEVEVAVQRGVEKQIERQLVSTRGVLRLESAPPGARVVLRDEEGEEIRPRATTPLIVDLPAGSYRAVLELDGFPPQERSAVVRGGGVKTSCRVEWPRHRLFLGSYQAGIAVEVHRGRTIGGGSLVRRVMLPREEPVLVSRGIYSFRARLPNHYRRDLAGSRALDTGAGDETHLGFWLPPLRKVAEMRGADGPVFVGDADGDGLPTLMTIEAGELRALDRHGAWSEETGLEAELELRLETIADFDGDGDAEILLARREDPDADWRTFYALTFDGRLILSRPGLYYHACAFGDLDGDGVAEGVFSHFHSADNWDPPKGSGRNRLSARCQKTIEINSRSLRRWFCLPEGSVRSLYPSSDVHVIEMGPEEPTLLALTPRLVTTGHHQLVLLDASGTELGCHDLDDVPLAISPVAPDAHATLRAIVATEGSNLLLHRDRRLVRVEVKRRESVSTLPLLGSSGRLLALAQIATRRRETTLTIRSPEGEVRSEATVFARVAGADAGDLDGDGTPEVAIVTPDGRIEVLDLECARVLRWKPPEEIGRVRLLDWDGDGDAEILAWTGDRDVSVLDFDHALRFQVLIPDSDHAGGEPRLAELDERPGREVLVAHGSGVDTLSEAGRAPLHHREHPDARTATARSSALGEHRVFPLDVDGDGIDEIVTSSGDVAVCVSGREGRQLWRTPARGALTAVALSRRGEAGRGLALGTSTGGVYRLDPATGEGESHDALGPVLDLAWCDFDGDGTDELTALVDRPGDSTRPRRREAQFFRGADGWAFSSLVDVDRNVTSLEVWDRGPDLPPAVVLPHDRSIKVVRPASALLSSFLELRCRALRLVDLLESPGDELLVLTEDGRLVTLDSTLETRQEASFGTLLAREPRLERYSDATAAIVPARLRPGEVSILFNWGLTIFRLDRDGTAAVFARYPPGLPRSRAVRRGAVRPGEGSLLAVDIDGDGTDEVVSNLGCRTVRVHDSSGTLRDVVDVSRRPCPGERTPLAVGDLDGDRRPELVLTFGGFDRSARGVAAVQLRLDGDARWRKHRELLRALDAAERSDEAAAAELFESSGLAWTTFPFERSVVAARLGALRHSPAASRMARRLDALRARGGKRPPRLLADDLVSILASADPRRLALAENVAERLWAAVSGSDRGCEGFRHTDLYWDRAEPIAGEAWRLVDPDAPRPEHARLGLLLARIASCLRNDRPSYPRTLAMALLLNGERAEARRAQERALELARSMGAGEGYIRDLEADLRRIDAAPAPAD